jgi:hypothetical protein
VYPELGYHGPEDLTLRRPRLSHDAVLRWLEKLQQPEQRATL